MDYVIGDVVKVCYCVDVLDEVCLDSIFVEWGFLLIWGGFGLLLIVFGVGFGVLFWLCRSMC